jgi:hypothetical protein
MTMKEYCDWLTGPDLLYRTSRYISTSSLALLIIPYKARPNIITTIRPANMSTENNLEDDEKSFEYKCVPEENAWLISMPLFGWTAPLFTRANQLHKRGEALEQDDLLPMPQMDHGEGIGIVFDEAWAKMEPPTGPSLKELEYVKDDTNKGTARLRRAIFAVMGPRFFVAGFFRFLNTTLQFAFPLLLNAILKFIEETQAGLFDEDDPWQVRYRGYWLSAVLLVTMGAKAITENAYFHRVYRAGYQARVAVSVAVYNKSLRVTNAERQSTTLGKSRVKSPSAQFQVKVSYTNNTLSIKYRRTYQSHAS